MIIIGIDPGVNTGFAIWNSELKAFKWIGKLSITEAMDYVVRFAKDEQIAVYVEDARKRTWFGSSGREVLQGAGSVKRDCKIWEDFLKEKGIEFHLVAPKNNKTKLNDEQFRKLTGYETRVNQHARDAGMLVFGR